jgi:hydrogenase expression/formation protein HypE
MKVNGPSLTQGPICPVPIGQYPQVLLAHGGGGKLTSQLIEKIFLPLFHNPHLDAQHDGAILSLPGTRVAFSTDSYVVHPLFFPGGDIGALAVNGTVNDLAMCGARPLYLSAGFIIEEGLPMDTLWRVAQSMQKAATEAGVQLVTGDTKVVDRGKGDGLYLNTAGIGIIEHRQTIGPSQVQPGDVLLVNGDLGRHGIAIMATREGLAFESTIESDCAGLAGLVQDLLKSNVKLHCMRDLTRGGLASAVVEIAVTARRNIRLDESGLRVREDVRGACEMLGLDPIYVANEGRFLAILPPAEAETALAVMRRHPLGTEASLIGQVEAEADGLVTLRNTIGTSRIIDRLSGEQLPRIC